MENLRNRVDVQLVTCKKKMEKLIASPAFHSYKIFNNDLAAVERKKMTLKLNRPIYVGFTILELSKVLMYDFHFNFLKRQYGDRAVVLFTDTDSLCYCHAAVP